jgi:putative membrane protein
MRKELAFLGALLLAAGCAHRYENSVVVSDNRSPYVANNNDTTAYGTTTYGTPDGVAYTSYESYPPYSYSREYDNSSKGSGARAMMANPYAEYTEPAGAALVTGDTEPETSRGAGARALTGETRATDNSSVVTTTTGTDTENITSQGQGARTLTGSSEPAGFVRDDAAFVREAAQAGLAEVRMGQLAQANAQNDQLKDFGQKLVNDHTKANDELSRIASSKGFQFPTAMSGKDDRMMEHLSSLNGIEFDKTCSRDAVEAHEKAVKLFKTEAQSGQDPDLKAFAQRTLPTLEDHLRMAKQLSKASKED